MKTTNQYSTARDIAGSSRLLPLAASFFATLLSLPAAATSITVPNVPLQSGGTVPPNIMFILDDSGSMANTFMPEPGATSDTAPTTDTSGSRPDIGQQTYALNGIYYNPATTYTPWKDSTGAFVANTLPTAAYSSANFASGSTTNLTSSVQTFYVPKVGTTVAGLQDANNYWRYQILVDGRVIRAERIVYAGAPPTTVAGAPFVTGAVANGSYSADWVFSIPAGATNLVVTSSGGTGTAGDLYIKRTATPTSGTNDCASTTAGTNAGSCTVAAPTTGTWHAIMKANGGAISGVTMTATYVQGDLSTDGCDITTSGTGWRNCTRVTPTGRTEAAEMQNFATWYSFYRTRTKTAKAGASSAFSDLGQNLRIGFTTIWGGNDVAGTRTPFNIPVTSDGGLFRDVASPASTNRTTWFNNLFAASTGPTTPLKGALQTAGTYYGRTDASGPYGPESGTAQLACRQNFTILTTDGFWNDNNAYTSPVGNSDNTTTAANPLPAGVAGTPIGYTAARPYSDSWSDTLADVANYYWKTDLRPTMSNIVPTSSDDPAYWQHMVTFSISIGLQGTLAPNDTTLASITSGATSWPDPTDAEDPDRIDDLWHAAVNGHGEFVAATNAGAFATGLKAALAAIGRRLSSGSSVATTGPRIGSSSRAFSASYFSGSWTGDVTAYPVTSAGIGATSSWIASTNMPVAASRNLFTFNGTTGISFAWASLTSAQQTALGSQAVFDYIRGVRTGEGTIYRARDTLLGDIVNSSPAYLQELATTTPSSLPAVDTVFVGANDGMLHAFNGATGVEQFAYVPGGVSFADLKGLADPSYAHHYFVDGPVVISTRKETPGKNVLVGALGRGGRGIFALDVADPGNFNASKVLWEQGSDPDMGNVLGKPIITKLNDGSMGLIVANGINSTSDTASLFIYNLTTGAVLSEINTGIGAAATPNGLISIKGWDDDGDGDVDFVYGGDLLGNVWKFDLSSAVASNWNGASNRLVLFTAKDAANKVQPITGGLTLATDPTTFNTWVFFGTGQFLVGNDLTSTDVQTWYGLIDGGATIAGRSALKQRQVTYASGGLRAFDVPVPGDMSGKKGWYLDLVNPPYGATEKVGERMVFDPIIIGGKILVESSQVPSSDACSPGGTGYVNAIDPFTGGSVSAPFFDANGDGVFTAADTVTVGGSQVNVGSYDPGGGMPSSPGVAGNFLVIDRSGGGKPVTLRFPPQGTTGRISWREILRD
ncbi:MAG TPA: PilC/PilY family type IV pilus protein [Arenimonas sp.]|uniref:PilC/PilY family type IV pilus protein n=1 Tax=Arenimonas sp. TaxID=1872635 RepID=UPI002C7C44B6|nr:PilC/PilY family type IV pilus protein [Arenimonas sp.]HMB57204.1 PilC/PilY family type IV pilus protein [Arenimonas sp.]